MRFESVEMAGCEFGIEGYALRTKRKTPAFVKVRFIEDNTVLEERWVGKGERHIQIPFGTRRIEVAMAMTYGGEYITVGSIGIQPPTWPADHRDDRFADIRVCEELSMK